MRSLFLSGFETDQVDGAAQLKGAAAMAGVTFGVLNPALACSLRATTRRETALPDSETALSDCEPGGEGAQRW